MELIELINRRHDAHLANEHRFLMTVFYNLEQYDLSLLKSINSNLFVDDRDKKFFELLITAKQNEEIVVWSMFQVGATTTFDEIKDYLKSLMETYKPEDMVGMYAVESDIRNLKGSYINNYFICQKALKKYLENPNRDKGLEVFESDISNAADYGLCRKETNHSKEFYSVLENSKPLFSTGLSALENIIGKVSPGQLFEVAGRPAMGKSAFGLYLFNICAFNSDKQTIFYSLEMSGNELLRRLISLNLHIPSTALDDIDSISPELKVKVDEVLEKYNPDINDNVHIIDGPKHIRDLICDMKRRVRKGNVGAIFIDYVGLIEGDGTEQQNIASASNALAKFAHNNNVTIFLISQLNANVDNRADHRPTQADIQYQIAKDADKVLLMYRPDYYNKDFTGNICNTEIIVSKNRQGSSGVAHVRMHMTYGDFKDLPVQEAK